jgi:hypothetical protein
MSVVPERGMPTTNTGTEEGSAALLLHELTRKYRLNPFERSQCRGFVVTGPPPLERIALQQVAERWFVLFEIGKGLAQRKVQRDPVFITQGRLAQHLLDGGEPRVASAEAS